MEPSPLLGYDAYKESALPWLGQIPAHWELVRKKYIFKERVQKGFPNEPLLAATQVQGVVRKTDYEARTVEASKDFHLLKLVKEGDFVISLRSFEGGIEYAHHQGIISPAYTVLTPRNTSEARYHRHLLKSQPFIQGLRLYVTGIREGQTIDYTKLSRSELPCPPPDECDRIANFLDQKTAEIDEAIAKKQRLIDLLKEQKAILINQAVTKGLNPDAPMRDSGNEWIGEIPRHWEVKPLRSLLKFISYGFTNPMPTVDDGPFMLTSNDIGFGELRLSTARRTSDKAFRRLLTDKSKPKQGDILVTKDGTLGRTALVSSDDQICISQSVALLRLKKDANETFVEMLLRANAYQEKMMFDAGGTTIKHIYITRLAKMRLAIPPSEEQSEIYEHCSNVEEDFALVIGRVEKEITLLVELKSTLITEAVTGKIKL